MDPIPPDANCTCPGLDFSSAINSRVSFAAIEGCETSRFGSVTVREIGAKSRARSKDTERITAGLLVCEAMIASSV